MTGMPVGHVKKGVGGSGRSGRSGRRKIPFCLALVFGVQITSVGGVGYFGGGGGGRGG